MSIEIIDFKSLERKVYEGIRIIEENRGDTYGRIVLERGMIRKKEHVIEAITPWNKIYTLGKYGNNEKAAKDDMRKYDKLLKKGCPLRITDVGSAEIIQQKMSSTKH